MNPRVYIETTIISYLTAWRSQELIVAANQETTREWWEEHRGRFELFVSAAVVLEVSAGDPDAVTRRLEVLASIPELAMTEEARDLAKRLVASMRLPRKARIDALHIALATVHSMDYLLTWNCRHIANARLRPRIEAVCRAEGYDPPIICTPLELME